MQRLTNLLSSGSAIIPLHVAVFALLSILLPQQSQSQSRPNRQDQEEPREEPDKNDRSMESTAGALEVPVVDSLYFVGPGDEINISIFGTHFYTHTVPVQGDGTIVVPSIGKLTVRRNSLRDVRNKLLRILKTQLRATDVLVTLAKPRKVKVTVSGAIREPGVVLLPATARVSEALALTEGEIEDTTSLRNIVITKVDGSVSTADLMRYYRTGDRTVNPFVTGGDVISFPRRDQLLGLFGAVNRFGWVDFVPGETLGEAIELAQGLKASAFLDSVEVLRFEDDNLSRKRIFLDLTGFPNNENANFVLEPVDMIIVRAIPEYRQHKLIVVEGEVRYEGSYGIIEGETTLRDVIHWAGGFTKDASLEEAIVTRKTDENERDREFERLRNVLTADMTEDEYEYFKARSRERVGQMVVDFKTLFLQGDSSQDIYLRDGDFVEIPKIKNYIRVIGRVDNPGNVIFEESWAFEDYIAATGGYGWRAEDNDVRVIKARTGELVDAEDTGDYVLEPGDTIWVPEEPEVKFWPIALEALGVLSQIAGIVGIVVAISQINK
jgi:polysaccharide biosynthesis/export protein